MKNYFFKIKYVILSACIVSTLLFTGCVDLSGNPSTGTAANGQCVVDFFDVGQADCALISLPDGKHILIDGGNNKDGKLVAHHLLSEGINTIDILIATHPHEDHIGGLDDVLDALDVKQVYMPEVAEKDIPTTNTYEDFLEAVLAEECDVTAAAAGDILLESEDYQLLCLSPNTTDISGLNNYSAVIKLTYKNTAFLFTGDAEKEMEEEMLGSFYDLSATVLKVGHHGSDSSSSADFLSEIDPQYAIISCGEDNSYGHPHGETIEKLEGQNIKCYRTDIHGSVKVVSDGTSATVSANKLLTLDGNR